MSVSAGEAERHLEAGTGKKVGVSAGPIWVQPPVRLTHLNFGAYHLRLALRPGRLRDGASSEFDESDFFRSDFFEDRKLEVTYG